LGEASAHIQSDSKFDTHNHKRHTDIKVPIRKRVTSIAHSFSRLRTYIMTKVHKNTERYYPLHTVHTVNIDCSEIQYIE